MSLELLAKNLDRGLYKQATIDRGPNGEQSSPLSYFAELAEHEGVAPDDVELKKRADALIAKYRIGEHETRQRRKAYEHAKDTFALDMLFREVGVDPTDPYAPTVKEVMGLKAFGVNSSIQAAFPIFYDAQIMEGLLASPLLDALVMESVQVNSGTADHVRLNETAGMRQTGETGEWARFNEFAISYAANPIKLKKWGGVLKASDEAVRRSRLPIFAAMLRRVGQQLMIDLTDFALDVILAGDGNTGQGAISSTAAATSGTPIYSDLVTLMMAAPIGYEFSDLVATKESIVDLLNMAEFKDPMAGFNFQRTGSYPTPVGLNLHRWDSLGSSEWATTKVLLFQRDRALVEYAEGGITSESDRIIDGQWSMVVTSVYRAYGIWDPQARYLGTAW